ncbi:WXG100 family type VII secretion target [Micromonospora sp. CB01531]|uniref:WXG100 family type VII secretion target n=1 Tax=Micromonospora sp. CB01531 TaxID=1718947 RepID=UPI00093D3F48|nr:WXG100 family type VII secretion target [Micromonospora sp. CB01531]OKI85864.1 hypothetical protein A6A27_40110 [Micromonospora sp. CB01531]
MTSYGLNPNGLLDTGDELTGVTRSIEQTTDNLNAVVNVFIARNEGKAKDGFVAAQQKWEAGIQKMKDSLANGVVQLNEIHERYRLGDAHGAALFQGNV